jgi:ABC-2 type transport system ATP-binding protein
MREVKRGFGRNSVALRFEGGEDVLDDRSLVASVVRHSDDAEALLAPGADSQELLRRLLEAGARVSKFELVEPSLHDIFIEKVRGAE